MTKKMTMADALITYLDNQYVEFDGVETKFVENIFGIFGHGCVLGVGQALQEPNKSIKFLQGKNEQNMAHSAIAYAKENNRRKIIPCTSSIGPGALNMVTAAGTATANRIPLLLLPGDTFSSRQPDPVLQQIEQESNLTITSNDSFKAVSKFWDRITRPEQLINSLPQAMRVLTSFEGTGAVTIALPQDVQGETFDYPTWMFEKKVWHMDRMVPSTRSISEAIALIKKCDKPSMIIGGGVRYSEAASIIDEFATKYNIAVTETQAGKGLLPSSHSHNLGGIGVTGTLAANKIVQSSDLIIAVGTRLGDFTTSSKWLFNSHKNIIMINPNAFDVIKMNSVSVRGDAKISMKNIYDGLDGYVSKFTDEITNAKEEWDSIVNEIYNDNPGGGLSQSRALGIINDFVDEKSIVLGSSGSLPGDLQRVWRSTGSTDYHVEYGFSCMGYEVNGALGAKIAKPNKDIYAMCGDGSYLMGHSEIVTSLQENFKINIMLFDNSGWGCIENLQNNHGSDTFGTVFKNRNDQTGELDGSNIKIDYAMNAESYGAKVYRITTEEELSLALIDSKNIDRTCLFDIKVLPKTMTDGFHSWWNVGMSEISVNKSVVDKSIEVKEIRKKVSY